MHQYFFKVFINYFKQLFHYAELNRSNYKNRLEISGKDISINLKVYRLNKPINGQAQVHVQTSILPLLFHSLRT